MKFKITHVASERRPDGYSIIHAESIEENSSSVQIRIDNHKLSDVEFIKNGLNTAYEKTTTTENNYIKVGDIL